MIYIDKNQVEKVIDLNEVMDCIELVYQIKDFYMPERMHVDRPEGTVLYMPCFTEKVSGTKIVSTFPDNIHQGLESVQGVMVLNDNKTGLPLAVIDGGVLTAYRTGAVGGVGIRHTTRDDCESVGLIGTGVQGFYQVLYACTARKINKIYLYDLARERAQGLKDQLEKKLVGVDIHLSDSSEDLVKNSDIIITATPATKPVLPENKDLLRGKHLVAIGSYKLAMREISQAFYEVVDAVYVDTDHAIAESGDLIVPIKRGWLEKSDIKLLGQCLNHKGKQVRTTLFKSVGMALFDLMVADLIYRKIKEASDA